MVWCHCAHVCDDQAPTGLWNQLNILADVAHHSIARTVRPPLTALWLAQRESPYPATWREDAADGCRELGRRACTL